MKKRLPLMVSIAILLVCGVLYICVPRYKVDQTFTYIIDKEKGEVIITGYLGDCKVREKFWNMSYDERKELGDIPKYIVRVEVPDKIKGYPVVAIGERAFEWGMFEELILPETVVTVENNAFYHCGNLKKITGTGRVEYIGDYAFEGCAELTEIDISYAVEIGRGAFANCSNISTLNLRDELNTISINMCLGMVELEEICIPTDVSTIKAGCFAYCTNLKDIYFFSDTISTIDENAFEGIESQLTIHAPKGSYAEQYANEMGIKYQEWQ